MRPNRKINLSPPARILLVDDDKILRSEFRECFEEYGIAEASCGEEALQYLKRPNEIDLVILDVRMQGMNGIDVLERIKEVSPEIKVIIFTGYGSKDTAVNALRSRADDYMEKPLNIDAARQMIERHLEEKENIEYGRGMDGKIKRVKEYILRNFHRKVSLNDAASAVYLSPKYLSRVFKEYVKMGFNDYKLTLRMEKAKELLVKTPDTIEQISDQLGYQNPESFIRQFKTRNRLSPTQFRIRMLKKKKTKAARRRKNA